MNAATRAGLGLVMFLVVGLGPACGAATSSTTSSPSPVAATSSTAPANGTLDPAVAMPNGFPSDFPIYPGARLTHASQVTANAHTSWGMEWETLDNATAVQLLHEQAQPGRLDALVQQFGEWKLLRDIHPQEQPEGRRAPQR